MTDTPGITDQPTDRKASEPVVAAQRAQRSAWPHWAWEDERATSLSEITQSEVLYDA